eukprot:s836_g4.t1
MEVRRRNISECGHPSAPCAMAGYVAQADLPPSDDESQEDFSGNEDADYLEYRSVKLETTEASAPATARFVFRTSQLSMELVQRVMLPFTVPERKEEQQRLSEMLFHLGLVLLVWPWMCFGPPCLRISAGSLTSQQQEWWRWFYRECLAEWAVVNGQTWEDIDLQLQCGTKDQATTQVPPSAPDGGGKRVMCPLGGGKDSLVVFEMLKHQAVSAEWLYVGEPGEFRGSRRLQGIVERSQLPCHVVEHDFGVKAMSMDRSRRFVSAGHPWAALVAFDAALCAAMLNFQYVAVGNEASADAGNGIFLTKEMVDGQVEHLEVNHQFDKSSLFGQRFHIYAREVFAVHHFSPLQQLNELQIAYIFATRCQVFHKDFISCNFSHSQHWCLKCEKCAFVFSLMSAYLEPQQCVEIFGEDLFEKKSLLKTFQLLLGPKKPFECVGEAEETKVALALARAKRKLRAGEPWCLKQLRPVLQDVEPSTISRWLDDVASAAGAPLPTWWQEPVWRPAEEKQRRQILGIQDSTNQFWGDTDDLILFDHS